MTPESAAAKATFQGLLIRSVFVPLAVMTLLAAALIFQVREFVTSAQRVEHTDEVITRLFQWEKTCVDLQSSVRGFMLTGEEPYLNIFVAGRTSVPDQATKLRELVSDRPEAPELIRKIEGLFREWMEYAETRIAAKRANDQATLAIFGHGNDLMNQVRQQFDVVIGQETALRESRNQRTRTIARWTILGAGGLTVLVGAFLSLLSRGQLRWLTQTYERALSRSRELSDSLERRVVERTGELQTANGKLNDANRELEAFAYSVSHDLRAPMRHISGFANLLITSPDAKLTSDDRENLHTIHHTAVTAGRMVDDLLAFSRIGRSQLKADTIDANALVAANLRELAPEIGGRKVEWNIAKLLPMHGDLGLLRLVVQNLLSNAVKYTSKREVAHIEAACRAEPGGAIYWVKDDGVGFDMEYAHKLFGVFQRLHRAEDFEGTGIGLANVRRIILRHGGRVWAEGKPGEGATFYFYLPNAIPRDPAGAIENETPS